MNELIQIMWTNKKEEKIKVRRENGNEMRKSMC